MDEGQLVAAGRDERDQVVMSPMESSSNWASTLNRTSAVSTRTVSGDGVSHIDLID